MYNAAVPENIIQAYNFQMYGSFNTFLYCDSARFLFSPFSKIKFLKNDI